LGKTNEGQLAMTTATNTSATSKDVYESTDRELTQNQLNQVIGGTTHAINYIQVRYPTVTAK
jgi:bacteriocin-like protein